MSVPNTIAILMSLFNHARPVAHVHRGLCACAQRHRNPLGPFQQSMPFIADILLLLV